MAMLDLVKFDALPGLLAWKYPSTELSTGTQLIVAESQEAVLFKGGQALDVFASGRHTLDTKNVPLLRELAGLPFGGKSPFTAEVWFVNKATTLDVKWGTPTPVQLQDPKLGVVVAVRSFGQFGLRVANSKQFLLKLVGTLPTFDTDNVARHFRGLVLAKVKDALSGYIVGKQIGVLEINTFVDELSSYMQLRIATEMEAYGLELVNFYVNDISFPEDDPGIMKVKEALAKKAEMDIIGYDYRQERSFDTVEGLAKNTGSPVTGLMGAGIGVGLGGTVGATLGKQLGDTLPLVDTAGGVACAACSHALPPGAKFCPECGVPLVLHCPACNAQLGGGSRFCHVCGQRVGGDGDAQ